MSELFDTRDELWSAPKAGGDVRVCRTPIEPSQYAALDGPQTVSVVGAGSASRQSGEVQHALDELGAMSEATGDLCVTDTVIDEPKHATLDGSQRGMFQGDHHLYRGPYPAPHDDPRAQPAHSGERPASPADDAMRHAVAATAGARRNARWAPSASVR